MKNEKKKNRRVSFNEEAETCTQKKTRTEASAVQRKTRKGLKKARIPNEM